MMGPPGIDITVSDQKQRSQFGIIPRAMEDLFAEAKMRQCKDNMRVQVVASYMEIYNDRLYDLLQPYKKGANR